MHTAIHKNNTLSKGRPVLAKWLWISEACLLIRSASRKDIQYNIHRVGWKQSEQVKMATSYRKCFTKFKVMKTSKHMVSLYPYCHSGDPEREQLGASFAANSI